jgi:hypothetical protein
MSEFWDQYKHPEWQKKRLEVIEKAGFKCQDCGATGKTLNVHHSLYLRDRKVWDYPIALLRCLCEECHEVRHRHLNVIRMGLGVLNPKLMKQADGYIRGLMMRNGRAKWVVVDGDPDVAAGVAVAFGLKPEDAHIVLALTSAEGQVLAADMTQVLSGESDPTPEVSGS